jgi:hypothetical protein
VVAETEAKAVGTMFAGRLWGATEDNGCSLYDDVQGQPGVYLCERLLGDGTRATLMIGARTDMPPVLFYCSGQLSGAAEECLTRTAAERVLRRGDVRKVASVLQACRIVVFATMFLSAASVPESPGSLQPPTRTARAFAAGVGFVPGLNLRNLRNLWIAPSGPFSLSIICDICGSIVFGCGLRGRAMVDSISVLGSRQPAIGNGTAAKDAKSAKG